MKILFCTDGSQISYNALYNFSHWIKKEETTVDAICVIDWSFLPDETVIEGTEFVNSCRNVADGILEYTEKEIKSIGFIMGQKIKLCGAAIESILDQLESEKYDLVVLGSHGKKGIQIWLGSVSREVLEASQIPTYISKNPNNSKNILFATDGSKDSLDAAERAVNMLNLQDKNIYACTVTENPDLLFLEGTLDANWMMAIRTQQQIYSDNAIKTILALFDKYKIDVTQSRILEGIPAQSIINYAKEENIDLIVTGSKIKTKMQRFLMDSVSKRVVENTKSDVFVIKNKIDEKNNTNK